jgi:hypothetical protein
VAQITEAQRVARIAQLLSALHKMPPEKHETVRMPWSGSGEPLLDVIRIGVDEVVLNPQSHRIRAQLQDDPEWEQLGKDPFSEAAQRVVERHVREARSAEAFAALKNSLVSEGQSDPGVMTHTGLLINANTRAVALRTVDDPGLRYIRVAVLPSTAKPDELALLELRLQMQKELKVEYTMTNELLFIEELSVKRNLSAAQIARELRIKTDSAKKGENEVRLRLKLLDLIRIMQKIPTKPLALTFFDRVKLEQLRDVQRIYASLIEREPSRAREHLESFLLSIAVDIKAVHELRHVDSSFMADFMLPQLEEDEAVGPFADALVVPPDARPQVSRPPGVSALLGGEDEDSADPTVDVQHLIDVVTSRDKRVVVPGTNVVLDRDDFKDALKSAVTLGIKDKKRVKRDEDQLAAPTTAVKQATQQVATAKEALLSVRDDPEFDDRRRKTLEAAHKKFVRACRDLERTLVKVGIITK